MKLHPTTILQTMIVLIGIAALAALIRLPLTEGRAENLDLLSIYSDPFILYGYAASVLFFATLYKTFKLLGLIKQERFFEQNTIRYLRSIRQFTIIFNILILLAGFYIVLFHAKEDDPVGFIALCFGITFICVFVTTAAKAFEAILKKGIELKTENGEQTL